MIDMRPIRPVLNPLEHGAERDGLNDGGLIAAVKKGDVSIEHHNASLLRRVSIRSEASALLSGAGLLSPRASKYAICAAVGGLVLRAWRRNCSRRATRSSWEYLETHRRNLPQQEQFA